MNMADETRTNSGKIQFAKDVTRNVFSEIMPVATNSANSGRSAINEFRALSRKLGSTSRNNAPEARRRSNNLFNQAVSAISSGNYNIRKTNDDLFDDFSDIEKMFDTSEMTEAEISESSPEDIVLVGTKGVAQSVIRSASAQLEGMVESANIIVKGNVSASKALAESINGTLLSGFNIVSSQLTVTNTKLDAINKNITALINYNNANTTKFYEKNLEMIGAMSKMMGNFSKSQFGKDAKDLGNYDTSRGFNIRDYMDRAKRRMKSSLLGSSVSMAKSMGDMMGPADIAGSVVSAIIPKMIAEPMKRLDKHIASYMDELLKRVGDTANGNMILSMLGIGDAFGNKRRSIGGINMSNYMKEAMPWNGKAQKALTEVIPEYLASIDAGINKMDKRYFDYDDGVFKRQKELEKSMMEEYTLRLGVEFSDAIQKMQKQFSASGVDQSKILEAEERISTILQNRAHGALSDKRGGYQNLKQSRQEVADILSNMNLSTSQFTDIMHSVESSIENMAKSMEELYARVGSTDSVYRNLSNRSNGQSYTKIIASTRSNMFSDNMFGENVDMIMNRVFMEVSNINPEFSPSREDREYIVRSVRNNVSTEKIISYMTRKYGAPGIIDKMTGGRYSKWRNNQKDWRESSFARGVGAVDDQMAQAAWGVKYDDKTKVVRSTKASTRRQAGKKASSQRSQMSGEVAGAKTAYRSVASDGDVSIVADTDRERIADKLADAATRGFDASLNASESQLNDDERTIAEGAEILERMPEDSGNGGQATKNLMDTIRIGMSSMIASFSNFGSRLFGKEGLIHKIFNSDIVKKQMDKLKSYLFDEENGIFKDQIAAVKKFGSDVWSKTKDNLKSGYNWVYDKYYTNKYGTENYEENEEWKNNEIAQKLKLKRVRNVPDKDNSATAVELAVDNMAETIATETDKLQDAMESTTEVIVGDPNESKEAKKRKYSGIFVSQLKNILPKAGAGAIAGAGLGALHAMSGGSLLTSMFLPGGPIGGAIVGGGLAILSQTEAFKSFMFGKMDKDSGERTGGMISKQLSEKFKKAAPIAVGGAVLGALKSVLVSPITGGGGVGVLGMQLLPGGILGGALLGMGMGLLKNSETFKSLLFGKKNEDGERSGTWLSKSFAGFKTKLTGVSPGLKNALKGFGIGSLSGAVLSNMGFIPAMLSMGGPVGMGVVGLGLGIASSTKKFDEWMFGTEEFDENGDPTGKRKGGLLGRVRNLLVTNVVEPITDSFKYNMLEMIDWTKDKITMPFRTAFGPILDSIIGIKDNVVDFVKDKFDTIGEGIKSTFQSVIKSIFSPITKLAGIIGKTAVGAVRTGTQLALAPLTIGLSGLNMLTAGKRRGDMKAYNQKYRSELPGLLEGYWNAKEADGKKVGFLNKTADTIGAYLGRGEVAATARQGWADGNKDFGRDTFNWMEVTTERQKLKEDRKVRRQSFNQWKNIDKLRGRIINRDLGGREVELTDAMVKKYRNKFTGLGIDEELLQSSDDIMDLLYRKGDFKKRAAGDSGLLGEAASLQKFRKGMAVDEQLDEAKQTNEYLKELNQRFQDFAHDSILNRNLSSYQDERKGDMRILRSRVKSQQKKHKDLWKGHNIDFSDPELNEYDIGKINSDMLNDYMFSDHFEKNDFKGWLASKGRKMSDDDWRRGTASVKADETTSEKLDKIANVASAQLEATTGGEITADDAIDRRGKSFGKRIMGNFSIGSIFGGLRKKLKIKAWRDKEAEESAHATALGNETEVDENGDPIIINNVTGEPKKQSLLSRLLGMVGGVASNPLGSVLKVGAGIFGLAGLTVGIMEILKPGTQDRLLKATDEITASIESGNVVEDYIKPLLGKLGDKLVDGADWLGERIVKGADWLADNFPRIFEDHIFPKIEMTAEVLAKNATAIVSVGAKLVEAFVPPLANAFVKVVPTIAGSFAKAIYNATVGKWTGLTWGDKTEKIALQNYPDPENLVEAINRDGIVSYTDPDSGNTVTVSGKNARLDDNGNIVYEAKSSGGTSAGGAMGKAIFRGTINSARSGVAGAAGRAATRGIGRVLGVAPGAGIGATMGIVGGIPGMVGGAVSGGATGSKVGANIVGGATGSVANAIRNSSIGGAFTNIVGSNRLALQTSRSLGSTGLTIGAEALEALGERSASILSNAGNSALGKMGAEYAAEELLTTTLEKSITESLRQGGERATKEAIEAATAKAASAAIKEAGGAQAAVELLSKRAANVASTAAKAAVDSDKKNIVAKFFRKLSSAIEGLMKDNVLTRLIKTIGGSDTWLGKILKSANKLFSTVAKAVLGDDKIWMKFATKIATTLAEVGLKVTPVAVLFAAFDLANGAFKAANLFNVPDDEVNIKMRAISSVMEALLGTAPGVLIDLGLEIGGAVLGKDFKCQMATEMYKALSDEDEFAALDRSQKELQIRTDIYNETHGTSLSAAEYSDKVNKGMVGSALDLGKQALNFVGMNFTTTKDFAVDEKLVQQRMANAGYGRGSRSSTRLSRGAYSQTNPKWANMPIGRFSNGQTATMANGGCGPTALAAAASDIMGIPISPAAVGKYAANSGFISEGGANSGLFTAGAAKLGLAGKKVDRSSINKVIDSGTPTVISGKGSGGPYTRAGHIVVAKGRDRNGNVIVNDPADGKIKKYSMGSIKSGMNTGWAYKPMGFGPDSGFGGTRGGTFGGNRGGFGSNGTIPYQNSYLNDYNNPNGPPSTYQNSYLKDANISSVVKPKFRGAGLIKKNNFSLINQDGEIILPNDFLARAGALDLGMGMINKQTANFMNSINTANTSNDTSNIDSADFVQALEEVYTREDWASDFNNATSPIAKLMKLGELFTAAVNAFKNSSNVWEEYGKIQSNKKGISGTSGVSASISDLVANPKNAADEILGKSIQIIANRESGGMYNAVNKKDGDSFSVGLIQANDENASTVLTRIANNVTEQADKDFLNKYATYARTGHHLSTYEADSLRAFLARPDILIHAQPIMDNYGKWHTLRNLNKYTGPLYDDGIVSNAKNIVLPTDIYNTGVHSSWKDGFLAAKRRGEVQSTNELSKMAQYIRGVPAYSKKSDRINYAVNQIDAWNMRYRPDGKLADTFGKMRTEMSNNGLGFGVGPLGGAPDDTTGETSSVNPLQEIGKIANIMEDYITNITGIPYTADGAAIDSPYTDGSTDPTTISSSGFNNYTAYDGSPPVLSSPNQQNLVDWMKSKYGKLVYSGAWDKQDPDKGSASCASTVAWAYRRAMGHLDPEILNTFTPTSSIAMRATEQARHPSFRTIWVNKGNNKFPMNELQPGDILYQNWNRTVNNDSMAHAEMYAGNGKDLSHGNPDKLGPVFKDLNAYRQKHTMMIRRHKAFPAPTLGYGPGAGTTSTRRASMLLSAIGSSKQFDSSRYTSSAYDMENNPLGFGSITNISNNGVESRLDRILDIIAQWYLASKNQTTSVQPSTTVVDASTRVLNTIKAPTQTAPSPIEGKIGKLKSKYQMFASSY